MLRPYENAPYFDFGEHIGYSMDDLKAFAQANGIQLVDQTTVAQEASDNIISQYDTLTEIKQNFDQLLDDTEREAYRLYLAYEQTYGEAVFALFTDYLRGEGATTVDAFGQALGSHFRVLDRFYLSLSQSRKSRAGKTFEYIHNALFNKLDYPFDSQPIINGKPDFLMPSVAHYQRNPMDCLIFTAKRTLRERWRQIVTEGTRGLGFFLATIDEKISDNQLMEMKAHRIYVVCPERIRQKRYASVDNVLSFAQFFRDHADPALARWKRNGVISS